jgi:predicted RNA-binding Zn-ribbon protein involved in translation (DUF1610 family)
MNWLRDRINAKLKNCYNPDNEGDMALEWVLSLIDQAKCEYTLIDDDCNVWQCSNCGMEWILENGSPKENEMKFCPKCGFEIKE